MKELVEKKVLKAGPYRFSPCTGNDALDALVPVPSQRESSDIRRDWKKDALIYKASPYILGYTGYIPGFSSRYGMTFRRAVEEGAVEWRDAQSKLKARREAMRAHNERNDPRNLLARVRQDNVEIELDHGHGRKRPKFDNHVSAEYPPIVGYTGHIPGAKGELALSKRYGQAAKNGLERLQKDRRINVAKEADADVLDRLLEVAHVDETGQIKA